MRTTDMPESKGMADSSPPLGQLTGAGLLPHPHAQFKVPSMQANSRLFLKRSLPCAGRLIQKSASRGPGTEEGAPPGVVRVSSLGSLNDSGLPAEPSHPTWQVCTCSFLSEPLHPLTRACSPLTSLLSEALAAQSIHPAPDSGPMETARPSLQDQVTPYLLVDFPNHKWTSGPGHS